MNLVTTAYVTESTRRVLEQRLAKDYPQAPVFLDADAYTILKATCARVIPQGERQKPINVAGAIDERLAGGVGRGWRYDLLPNDRETFQLGLAAIGRLAGERFQTQFSALDPDRQDEILTGISQSDPLFFEELLAMAVEIYYAHPIAQDEIKYVGFADAAGWTNIGLDEYEAWEPRDQ